MVRNRDWLLYWAFGSNLDPAQMQRRCPGAVKFAPLTMDGGRLVFRGEADVVSEEGSKVAGGLWWINRDHERDLDLAEGVRGGTYAKRYIQLSISGKVHDALYYKMRLGGVYPPAQEYYNTILRGYRAFGLDENLLQDALNKSYRDWEPKNGLLRHRWVRKGARSFAVRNTGPAEEGERI